MCRRERQWLKPENQNITNTTICAKCGGRGHLAQDCLGGGQMANYNGGPPVGGPRMGNPAVGMDRAKMDSEVRIKKVFEDIKPNLMLTFAN